VSWLLLGAHKGRWRRIRSCSPFKRLALLTCCDFAENPSQGMTLLTVLGTSGKTTTSWLIRGLLEQAGQLTGMVGSIEYALAEHLMTPDANMWAPNEADSAAGRECSSPFHLVPYKGRYCVEEATPSGLRVQVGALATCRWHWLVPPVATCKRRRSCGLQAPWPVCCRTCSGGTSDPSH
jgi:hypothetical protein